MRDLIFMFDLDGTLKTAHDNNGPFNVPHITVESGEFTYNMLKRPHVDEMLQAANKVGRVFLSTAAGGGYARKVLKAFEIEDYFEKIIAVEDFRMGIPYYSNCVFIDDDRELVRLKMDSMAKGSSNPIRQDCWIVPVFQGNADDKVCLEIIEEINKVGK